MNHQILILRLQHLTQLGPIQPQKNKITKLTVSIIVSQPTVGETPNTEYRTYTFLDDKKPIIVSNPLIDGENTFVQVEAGTDYDDQYADFKNFNILDLSSGILTEQTLRLEAEDLTDGDLGDKIVRTTKDLTADENVSVQTGYDHVNHVFFKSGKDVKRIMQ